MDWHLCFQVRVKVIQARQLQGANIQPVTRVTVYNQTQQTRVQKSTNTPYWNQSFFFNFHASPAELFDELIEFQVFNSRRLRSDALIGSFKVGVWGIFVSLTRLNCVCYVYMKTQEEKNDWTVIVSTNKCQLDICQCGDQVSLLSHAKWKMQQEKCTFSECSSGAWQSLREIGSTRGEWAAVRFSWSGRILLQDLLIICSCLKVLESAG